MTTMSDYQIQTRRRSRSKTPMIPDIDVGDDGLKAKASHPPKVQTITEEVVEVTSSSSLTPVKKTSNQNPSLKTKTSDYSSEDQSPELLKQQQMQQPIMMGREGNFNSVTNSTTKTTSVYTQQQTKITKHVYDNLNTAATSTPKSNSLLENFTSQFSNLGRGMRRRSKEIEQNEFNTEFERSQQQAKQNNRSFSRIFSSSFTSGMAGGKYNNKGNTETDAAAAAAAAADHLAYLEYKRAGEYWKNTPKTDYTYSEFSPHRRVLAPGVVAMPNMSRRSLENHHDRINFMIQRNPAQEQQIRRRYESNKYQFSSSDEADYASYGQQLITESWWRRFINSVKRTFSRVGFGNQSTGVYTYPRGRSRTPVARRGFFGSIGYAFVSMFSAITSLFSLESNQTQIQHHRAGGKGKRIFWILLLLLLPLLLLAGVYYYLHPERSSFPQNFPQLTFPSLPVNFTEIDLSKYVDYNAIKIKSIERYNDVRDWTNDYWLYLRTLTENLVESGRTFFRREEYYERV